MFLTWRLAGSLPCQDAVGQSQLSAGQVFVTLDRQADRAHSGPLWLRDRRIAQAVVETLLYGERERKYYSLRSWVVMPNHVHVLLKPQAPLPVITRWVKGSTARQANLLLERTGKVFWQDESHDHWARSDAELEKIVRYIERNPVTAGLVESEEDWPWSSAGPAGESACPWSCYILAR